MHLKIMFATFRILWGYRSFYELTVTFFFFFNIVESGYIYFFLLLFFIIILRLFRRIDLHGFSVPPVIRFGDSFAIHRDSRIFLRISRIC